MPIPRRIRVLAVGKASLPMLTGALRVLGKHVVSGILVAPKTEKITRLDKRIVTFRTGHPIPDREGLRASRYVMASIGRMHTDELLLCLISGGASAMLPAPAPDITLDDKRRITQRLIRSRASIREVNTVRRHLSELKGGRLVERCRAGQLISLIVSDVPGNTLSDIASGMTAPDPTTFQDAINVLKEFNLWDSAPRRITNHLGLGSVGHIPDTPKPGDEIFQKVHNVIVADNRTACEAVQKTLNKTLTPTTVLISSVDMDARSLGRLLASIASDSEALSQPLKRPGALVLGGETTVDVKGRGKGGRNQEVALAALTKIAGVKGVAIAALGTDGIDGNSPAAGAVIDGQSMTHAARLGLHVRKFMAKNDSYSFFRKLGDSIITGRTGTNVGDIYLLVQAK
jgi:glycerate-2-kinase